MTPSRIHAMDSPSPAASPVSGRAVRLLDRTRRTAGLYLLVLPTIVSTALIGYYPNIDSFVMSLYRWTPGQVQDYIGLGNFMDAMNDPLFWQSFRVVLIMLLANLVKMWPGIFAAIALHRLASDKWRYRYQVLFVVPMVVPGMVWLLIWKSFYDPEFGLLNRLLNASGLMDALALLDGTKAAPGWMPRIASALEPVLEHVINPCFGSAWGVIFLGAVMLAMVHARVRQPGRWLSYTLLLMLAGFGPYLPRAAASGNLVLAVAALAMLAMLLAALARVAGTVWILWPFLIGFGIWAVGGRTWLLPILLTAGIVAGELARRGMTQLGAADLLRWAGGSLLALGGLLVLLGTIWTVPTGQFSLGTPAWLGHRDLVLPALILWGFPWVGTVGVLIYLAGLQQISNDVYEAAELDGVGPIGKLFRIELPLIMTQVRINLIFMTIGTLTGYGFFLILLGPTGGPGNVGMVPGLYMYSSAFLDQKYGYACALGVVMFVIILLLTIIYQKYVKVEK